jgi:hypothetical protein
MNPLTPWFRKGRSSYGDVGPLPGEDRVDPDAPTIGPQFHIETLTFQEEHPESRWQRHLNELCFSFAMFKVLLKSGTERGLGDTILRLNLRTLG